MARFPKHTLKSPPRHPRGNLSAFDSLVGLVSNGDLQQGAFAGEPGLGIDQFQEENLVGCRGIRRRCQRRILFVLWQREMERARSKLLDDSAVLLIETLLQRSFTVRVQGKQVEVIIRSPVQYAPAEIYGGIDECVGGTAIFRLDVIRRVACFHVRIVTEEHSSIRPDLRGGLSSLRRKLSAAFDRLAAESLL